MKRAERAPRSGTEERAPRSGTEERASEERWKVVRLWRAERRECREREAKRSKRREMGRWCV